MRQSAADIYQVMTDPSQGSGGFEDTFANDPALFDWYQQPPASNLGGDMLGQDDSQYFEQDDSQYFDTSEETQTLGDQQPPEAAAIEQPLNPADFPAAGIPALDPSSYLDLSFYNVLGIDELNQSAADLTASLAAQQAAGDSTGAAVSQAELDYVDKLMSGKAAPSDSFGSKLSSALGGGAPSGGGLSLGGSQQATPNTTAAGLTGLQSGILPLLLLAGGIIAFAAFSRGK